MRGKSGAIQSESSRVGGGTWLIAGIAVLLACAAVRIAPPGPISGLLTLAGCHIPVFLGARSAARRLAGRQGRGWTLEAVLTLQIYFTTLVSLGLALGVLGILTRPALVAAAAVAGFALLANGSGGGAERRTPRRDRVGVVFKVALLAVIMVVTWKCVTDAEYVYDVLNYHLVFPAQWIQDGRVSIVPTWFGDPAPAYAPSSTEVYFVWLLAPMMSDELARCGQFPYWLLMLAGVDLLGGALRLSRNGRRGLVLFVAMMPGMAHQAATAMVDVAAAAQLVCVSAFSLRAWRGGKKTDAIALALSAGGLLGTKFIALTYLAILMPLIVLAAFGLWRSRRRWLRGRAVWLCAASAAWIGGYWYVRNTWVTGSPFYPLDVKIGSVALVEGAFGRAQMENSFMNARRLGLLRALPDVLWQSFATVQSDDFPKYPRFAPALGLGALLIGNLLGFGSTFMAITRRLSKFLFYVCAIGCIAVFWLVFPIQDFRYAWGPLVLLIAGAARAARGRGAPRWIMGAAAIAVVACTYLPFWNHWLMRRGGEEPDDRRRAVASSRWRGVGEGWSHVDHLIHGATIAYTGNNVPYFLYGRHLENRVRYVPARDLINGCFHDFASLPDVLKLGPPNTAEPTPDRYQMDPAIWLKNLKSLGIEYVVVTSLRPFPNLTINLQHDDDCFPIERKWLDALALAQPHCIEKKSLGPDFLLYQLKWNEGCPPAANLSPVTQTVVDALDSAANYPCAPSIIKTRRLLPIPHSEFRIPN